MSALSTPLMNLLYNSTHAGRATEITAFFFASYRLQLPTGSFPKKLEIINTLRLSYHAMSPKPASESANYLRVPRPFFFISFSQGIGQPRIRSDLRVAAKIPREAR